MVCHPPPPPKKKGGGGGQCKLRGESPEKQFGSLPVGIATFHEAVPPPLRGQELITPYSTYQVSGQVGGNGMGVQSKSMPSVMGTCHPRHDRCRIGLTGKGRLTSQVSDMTA